VTKPLPWQNDTRWLRFADCHGTNIETWYEDPLPFDAPINKDALDFARFVCSNCPSRRACAGYVLAAEAGQGVEQRDGIWAGMTPAQRHSIEKRGGLGYADPIDYIAGYDTAKKREVPPVPDTGDQWSRHYTTLARKLLRWLATNVPEGAELPTQSHICDALACRPGALRRVLDALVADGTLELRGNPERKPGDNAKTRTYVRNALPKAVGSWQPKHLSIGEP
jgi:hypothetical protein